MTPAIILDVLIAAILLTAILRSSWRGLFLSLSGVIVLILTIIGANLGAKALTQPVADWATPKIEEKIAAKVEKTLEDRTQEQGRTLEELLPDSLRNLLNRTGLMENLRGALERQAESTIAATARAIAAAVARELVESFAYAILYVLLFLALGAVLHVASLGISMLLRLPLLSSANTLGGALLGLLEGMIVVWLLIWLIPHFGVVALQRLHNLRIERVLSHGSQRLPRVIKHLTGAVRHQNAAQPRLLHHRHGGGHILLIQSVQPRQRVHHHGDAPLHGSLLGTEHQILADQQGVCIQQKQHRRNDGDVAQAEFQLQTAPESSALIL